MSTRKSMTASANPYEIFHDLAPPDLNGLTACDPEPRQTMEEYAQHGRGNAIKARVLFTSVRQTWGMYLKYLTGMMRYIQSVRVRLLLDVKNTWPPPAVEHVIDDLAGDELVIYLADGGEIRSGRVDKHDPRRGAAGDYLKLLDYEGNEIAFVETADLLATPELASTRLQNFLIAAAGVRHVDHH